LNLCDYLLILLLNIVCGVLGFYKLKKSLYGLKQAPIAWYERLDNLLEKDFQKGQVDTPLFKKTPKKDILVVQIYVDDIIFGSTNATLCKEFSEIMQVKFETSMMKDWSSSLEFKSINAKMESMLINPNIQRSF